VDKTPAFQKYLKPGHKIVYYGGYRKDTVLECDKGHQWTTSPKNRKFNCAECKKDARIKENTIRITKQLLDTRQLKYLSGYSSCLNTDIIWVECLKCGHKRQSTFRFLINRKGRGCFNCHVLSLAEKSYSDIKGKLLKLGYSLDSTTSNGFNNLTRVQISCLKCLTKREGTYNHFRSYPKCQVCFDKQKDEKLKDGVLKELPRNGYTYLKHDVRDYKAYITVRCLNGHEFERDIRRLRKPCTLCNPKPPPKWNEETVKKYLSKNNPHLEFFGYSLENKAAKVYCTIHSYHFKIERWHTFKAKRDCPKCIGHYPLSQEEMKDRIHSLGFTCERLPRNTREIVTIRCSKGHFFKRSLNCLKKNIECPKCVAGQLTSKGERVLQEGCKILAQEFGLEIIFNERLLGYKEIDIYFPTEKIGIEHNGLYHHSGKRKPRNYHLNKWHVAREKGIVLLQFWSDECKEMPKVTEYIKKVLTKKIKLQDLDGTQEHKNNFYATNRILDWRVLEENGFEYHGTLEPEKPSDYFYWEKGKGHIRTKERPKAEKYYELWDAGTSYWVRNPNKFEAKEN
jgi:hypothetical protein